MKKELSEEISEGIYSGFSRIMRNILIGLYIAIGIIAIFIIFIIPLLFPTNQFPTVSSDSITEGEMNHYAYTIKYGCIKFALNYFNDSSLEYEELILNGYKEVESVCDIKDVTYYILGECITKLGLNQHFSITQTSSFLCVTPLEIAKLHP